MTVESKESNGIPRVVRPDLFITPDVVGLSVPSSIADGGRLTSKWKLALQWKDGKPEMRDLEESLPLPNGGWLYFDPMPPAPSPKDVAAWSVEGQQQWLSGASVDPAEVFAKVDRAIGDYIDLPPEHERETIGTLASWVVLSYVYPAWPAVPYLFVTGPLGSGKTRVFEILRELVYRPLSSSSVTAPWLFRTLHGKGGTLLFDEAERLRDSDPEARNINTILLAGYKRGQRATRLVGDAFESKEFDVFGLKALAAINGLPPALASRTIPLAMFRADRTSPKARRRVDAEPARWADLRDDLHALAVGPLGQAAIGLAAREDVCNFGNRDYELWQPILAVAKFIDEIGKGRGGGLHGVLTAYASQVISDSEDEQTPEADEILLRALDSRIGQGQSPKPKEILEDALGKEPQLFQRWSERGISEHLKRYGIRARKSNGERRYRDVSAETLAKIAKRYRMDLSPFGAPEGEGQMRDGKNEPAPSPLPTLTVQADLHNGTRSPAKRSQTGHGRSAGTKGVVGSVDKGRPATRRGRAIGRARGGTVAPGRETAETGRKARNAMNGAIP